MVVIALTLQKTEEKTKSRVEVEGERLLYRRLFLHEFDQGQPSSLILGQPGSCKTAVSCSICEYFMNNHSSDKLYWRSALNAPLQIVKLPKWHIWVEKNSGVRFFDRRTGFDITDSLKRENKISYFNTFEELFNKSKSNVCNGIFFKDLHHKQVKKDQGTLRWFQWQRFLLNQFEWCHIFYDEYQEMVKSGNGEQMYWEIDRHSDDVSSSRKTHVGIHANCHQTAEIDWRVLPSFMMTIQLFGSRVYKHNMVNKQALGALREPNEYLGAEAWISEGGKFGKVTFNTVYKLKDIDIAPRIVSEYEHTKVCPICHHVFVYNRIDQMYCGNACTISAHRKRKKLHKTEIETTKHIHNAPFSL